MFSVQHNVESHQLEDGRPIFYPARTSTQATNRLRLRLYLEKSVPRLT